MPHHEPESEESSNTPPQDPRDESTASRQFFRASAPTVLREGEGPLSSLTPLPERIGHYRIIRIIGEGGMGMVLEAEQDKPKRIVALKVILPGVAKPEMIRRFADESEMLGLLQHPGIAQVYEAGVFDMGGGTQPYFAMEFIRGKPLTEYAREHQLGTRERLQLMIKVCEAVQHAHQKGVIHRDLKPSNILVVDDEAASRDAHGLQSVGVAAGKAQPKILDFGVARLTASDIQSATLRTDIGQLIGTIPYMSPEQTEGDPRNLDTRSDVYALGVICYELLADRLPYDLQQKMIHEAVRVIREDDPTPLSSVNRIFRGDVETIVAKALEKDRERRYQSATELANDIERYLKDEPIIAKPTTQWYRVRKFARRNKALVGGVVATMVALAAGLIASLILLKQADAAWKAESKALASEKERADELDKVATFQAEQLSGIDASTMGVRLRADLLERKREYLSYSRHDDADIAASIRDLEESLAGVNFTDAALKTLDENIFEKALNAVQAQFADQPLVKGKLLQSLAETMRTLGLLQHALAPQTEALTTRRQILGNRHADTIRSEGSMGILLYAQGDYSDAEPYLQNALQESRLLHGNSHQDTLELLGDLGALRHAQGDFADAEKCYREVLTTLGSTLGNNSPVVLDWISNLGILLQDQGKFDEAETYLREALKSRRNVLGNEHKSTLVSITNMGALLQAQDRVSEAESYVREALEIQRRMLGDGHPDTLISISTMGSLLQALGHLSEAEAYDREALERSRQVLGEDHPDTLNALGNYGSMLRAQGRLSDAEPYYREALARTRRVRGDDHLDTLIAIGNMGSLLKSQGNLASAEPYMREALEKSRKVLGNEHQDTLISIYNLARLLRDLGSFDEAMALGYEVHRAASAQLAPSNSFRRAATVDYARTLLAARRFENAVARLLEAQKLPQADMQRVIGATQLLIDAYDAWNLAEPNKGYDLKAAEWKAKLAELQAATQPAASHPVVSQSASAPSTAPVTQSATQSSIESTTKPASQP